MRAPRRWKDAPGAPVGVRELLSAGRPPRGLDEASFERGARRIARLSAAPVAGAAALGLWTKLAAAALIGAASVGAVAWVRHAVTAPVTVPAGARDHANTAVGTQPATVVMETKAPDPAEPAVFPKDAFAAPAVKLASARVEAKREATIERGNASEAGEAEPVVVEAAPSPPLVALPSTLGAELALLEAARTSLAGDPRAALAKLGEHRANFPSGALRAERDLIELDALRRAGLSAEARARGQAWLAREPNGLHASRVRAILVSLGP